MKEDTIPDSTTDQLDDLDITREAECIAFEIGDNVVYPHHGAGQVIKKEQKEIREGLRRLQEINLVDRYLQT